MRIGILTFHRPINYGALLQAFALRTTIIKNGVDADIIDYRNSVIESQYVLKSFFDEKGIAGKIHYILTHNRDKKKSDIFEAFRYKYLGIDSTHALNDSNIISCNGRYDAFICGSDQVWNPKAHAFDKNYYLSFVSDKSKKHSYAASFGEITDEKYYSEIKPLIEDFEICSVREKDGCNIIANISEEQKTRVDIDPVFLLDKNEWQNAFEIKDECKKRYAVLYLFKITAPINSLVEQLYSSGYEIVYIGKPLKNPFSVPVKLLGEIGPVEFVKLFFNASFVVTNSFHGTAFSILFNKPFAVELNTNTSRLVNITELTGLQNRIISENTDFSSFINQDIDWCHVNNVIHTAREDSMSYIREIVTHE